MKTRLIFVCVTLILSAIALSAIKTTDSVAAAGSLPGQVVTVPLYILQNDAGFYFYTIDAKEMATLEGTAGWGYVGICCYVLPNNKKIPGSAEVYRLTKDVTKEGTTIFNVGAGTYSNHFYTSDHKNAQHAVDFLGWRMEGVPFYVSPNKLPGTVPLYRFYMPYYEGPAQAYGTNYYNEQHILTTDKADKTISPKAYLVRIEGYVWQQATPLDAVTGMVDGGTAKTIDHPAAMTPGDQLFTLGCSPNNAKGQISCPSIRGWETCNFYRQNGELKSGLCTTTADQFAFANMQTDLTTKGCKRFLNRADEYYCKDANGVKTCEAYLNKKDGLVTRCLPLNYKPK